MKKKKTSPNLIASNKQARRLYDLLETLEAGLSLTGSEVKSVRASKVSFKDGYVEFGNGEAFLVGVHIAPYENAGYAQHEPERKRRLLMHRAEIDRLRTKAEQKGLTVIPTKMYFSHGKAKVEVALAKGKKTFDRRDDLKQRDIDRDTARQLAER
ncbi:MAG: SsrA-binding protein [Desulfovibrionales bacterium]|jgi:SsrA-binding protein|nr:SsrA-binding protein [Desulfovibrionales bacterium]